MIAKTKSSSRSPPTLLTEITKIFITLIMLTLLAGFLLMTFSAVAVWFYGWDDVIKLLNQAAFAMNHQSPTAFLTVDLIHNPSLRLSHGFLGMPATKVNAMIRTTQQSITLTNSVLNLLCLRCEYSWYASPVLGLFGFLGFVEGLIQRDLRKWRNARESTLFFHRSKQLCHIIFFNGYFLFISVPMAFNPTLVFFGFSIVISFCILLTTRSFKKYL